MSMVTAGIITGGASIISGIFGASAASKRAKAAAADKRDKERKLLSLENSRQEIINPYEGVTDLSSMVQNPYENLGVATQAAEMQAEQADISLANTLDTLRSSGASAGGATALAQAALQSKKGVAASIEMQEAQNEKMRAAGDERLQAAQTQEQVRVQGVNIQEGRRMQTADAEGRKFEFNAQEKRDLAIIELIYSSGLRVSETVNVNLGDFEDNKNFLRVLGKGSKTRLVPVGRYAQNAINDNFTYLGDAIVLVWGSGGEPNLYASEIAINGDSSLAYNLHFQAGFLQSEMLS